MSGRGTLPSKHSTKSNQLLQSKYSFCAGEKKQVVKANNGDDSDDNYDIMLMFMIETDVDTLANDAKVIFT